MVDGAVAGASVIVAAVLFIAGPGKLAAPATLATALSSLAPRALTQASARGLARGVGASEVVLAVLLATAVLPRLAAVGLGVLGTGILAASALAKMRGVRVPCGCFGAVDRSPHRTLDSRTMAFGAVFMVVAVAHGLVPPPGWPELRVAFAVTLALGLVLASRAAQLRPLIVRGLGRGQ